jgi:hypothetical protein
MLFHDLLYLVNGQTTDIGHKISAALVCLGIAYTCLIMINAPLKKLSRHVNAINELCDGVNLYYVNHDEVTNKKHTYRLTTTIMKHIAGLEALCADIPDQEPVKKILQDFVQRWTFTRVEASLLSSDGKFISDNNYLLTFFPASKKRKWKTLFPIFKP